MTSRRPEAIWRVVPEEQFLLRDLLRLLFEPDPEQDEREAGSRRGQTGLLARKAGGAHERR